MPDAVLVEKGLIDESTGLAYDPSDYADHGSGLFFVGVEQDGRILAYALNQSTGAYTRVAEITSGFPKLMELTYEPETKKLWAICDDSCDGRTARMDIAQSGPKDGRFVVTETYERPGGMPNLNNEGFAIAPQAECVGGLKPVFYADDSNTGGHALRTGKLNCTPLAPQPPVSTPTPTPTPQQPQAPSTAMPATPDTADRTAPQLALALKFTKSGTFAVRRTGKFRLAVTLGERADLTITATTRASKKAKVRTILTTTRTGVAAGKPTYTLSLKRSVRAALKRNQAVTVTVKARDAAGNVTTRSVTGKVR
jgi:hypothetical protein